MDRYANPYAPLLDSAASEAGVDADYLARIMKIESGGDPNNRTGSYRGLFQLSPQEFTKYGGTGDIYDPEQNARAAARKTAAEAQAFQTKFGRAPTSTDLYMTHQQGEGGYAQHIAAPDAPAWQNMYATAEGRQKGPGWAKQAIWGNIPDSLKPQFGSVNNVKSQDLIDIYARKLGYGADAQLPLSFAGPVGLPQSDEPPAPGSPAAMGSIIDTPMAAEDATLPPAARPTAGQTPPGPPPGAPAGPPTGNLPFGIPGTVGNNPIQQALGDNFSTLLAFAGGARQGGIGQGLSQAARASLIEGPENRKLKMSQDQQLGIYQALRQKGVPHADAMSAAMSPEILKQMAPDVFGSAWKFEKVKDAYGGEVPVFVNPRSGEIRDQSGKPYNPEANPATSPEAIDNTVKAVLEGRMAPPTSFAASKPYWQSILRRAAEVEPNFDLTTWQARQQGVKNFTSGKDAESVRAIDQTLHHMAALVGSAKELPGTSYQAANKVINFYRTQTGSDAEGNFLLNAHAVAEEMSKVYKGGNLSDAEIRSWEKSLHPNMSPDQQRGAIRKLNELLQGGLHALEEKRLGAVGPAAAERMGPLLKPAAAEKLQGIEGWLSPPKVGPAPPGNAPASTATPAAPAANPYEAEMRRRGLLK